MITYELSVLYGLGQEKFDQEGRVLTLEFADFYFVTAYFPNAQDGLRRLDFKLEFNQVMLAYLNKLAAVKTVLLCGDLNVAHKEIDLARPKENVGNPGFSNEERASLETILQAGYAAHSASFTRSRIAIAGGAIGLRPEKGMSAGGLIIFSWM